MHFRKGFECDVVAYDVFEAWSNCTEFSFKVFTFHNFSFWQLESCTTLTDLQVGFFVFKLATYLSFPLTRGESKDQGSRTWRWLSKSQREALKKLKEIALLQSFFVGFFSEWFENQLTFSKHHSYITKSRPFSKVQGTKNWLIKYWPLPKLQKSKGRPETTSPIHFNGTRPSIPSFRGLEIPYLPLDELLATCDYISLHAPLLPSTKHMISFEKLAIMKKGIMKHGGQHETSSVTTMKFPPFARKSEWNRRKLWNDRARKQKGSKVCLFIEYGLLLKQKYSTSHHSFCFCLYKYLFFGAMELWNLSEDCLAREVAPDLFARIVNTSRGGLIDTRALIHGHFVRNRTK